MPPDNIRPSVSTTTTTTTTIPINHIFFPASHLILTTVLTSTTYESHPLIVMKASTTLAVVATIAQSIGAVAAPNPTAPDDGALDTRSQPDFELVERSPDQEKWKRKGGGGGGGRGSGGSSSGKGSGSQSMTRTINKCLRTIRLLTRFPRFFRLIRIKRVCF